MATKPKGPDIDMTPMEMKAVKSSRIDSFGYRAETATLALRFKNGATYHYGGVTPQKAALFERAKSKGKWFAQAIAKNKDHPFKPLPVEGKDKPAAKRKTR